MKLDLIFKGSDGDERRLIIVPKQKSIFFIGKSRDWGTVFDFKLEFANDFAGFKVVGGKNGSE